MIHRLLERVRPVGAARVVTELGGDVREELLAPLVVGVAGVHVIGVVLLEVILPVR